MKFCPHCSLILEQSELKGKPVWICHSCGGIWAPSLGETSPTGISDDELNALNVRNMTSPSLSVYEGLTANCPDCRMEPLQPQPDDTHQKYKSFICSKCGGMWFDPIPQSDIASPATPTNATVTAIETAGTETTPEFSEGVVTPPSEAVGDSQTAPMDSVLSLLKQGNIRFASGQPIHPDQDEQRRNAIALKPSPIAIVICCSDARVPPEIVLDQGLGSLFVIRTAGLVLDQTELATITYAVTKWRPPLVLALGHSQCAAVTEALDSNWFNSSLQPLLKVMQPRFTSLPSDNPDKVDAAVRVNTLYVMNQMHAISKDWRQNPAVTPTLIAGGIYDINTGLVEWLEYAPPPQPSTTEEPENTGAHETPQVRVLDKPSFAEPPPVQPTSAQTKTQSQSPPQQTSSAFSSPKISLWCPRCLTGYPDTVQFCTRCGVALVGPNARIKCATCGKVNTINAERCWNCQVLLHPIPSASRSIGQKPVTGANKAGGCATGVLLSMLTAGVVILMAFFNSH
jgi:carbonic anhydrase